MLDKHAHLEHNFVTLTVAPGVHMHAYLMCEKQVAKQQLEALITKLIVEAEKRGPLQVPIILSTLLKPSGVETVYKVLERFPEVSVKRAEATAQHQTAWLMTTDDPDDDKLMQLH